MKRYFITIMMLITLLASSSIYAGEKTPVTDYIIGAGDTLEITVWDNTKLTKTVVVLPDGKINFPLIGEITAGGKSVAVFKKELEEKIKAFVADPNLSVVVQQVGSMMIYVIGKVNQPGRFVLNSNVNTLQALAMAGGLNAFAKKNKIRIFRKTGSTTNILYFDYDAVTEGEKLEQNIMLKKGDVVVVP